MLINAIIVDDEKRCIDNLLHYLSKLCPGINILATGNNLPQVLEIAGAKKIDLAFLDVELFDNNIFTSLNDIENITFEIIFVTAYQQYALKAIKVEAFDYILKPLAEDDIRACYLKIKRHFDNNDDNSVVETHEKKHTKIILKNAEKVYIIKPEDIYYIAGHGFYSDITFLFEGQLKTVVVSKPLNKAEAEYTHAAFFRVHKSYIVNIDKIASIIRSDGLNIRMKNEELIPVAKRREHDFLSFLNHGK